MMRPRCLLHYSRTWIERGKTELLASNAAVLQIEPALPTPTNRVYILQIKVRIFVPNGDTDSTHDIIRIGPFHTKKAPPEPPMRVNTQEGLTQSDEAGDV